MVLIGIILLISYNTYQDTQESVENPIVVIPNNASIILQLNEVKNLSRSLKLSNIWMKLQNIQQVKNIAVQAEEMSDFFTNHQDIFTSNNLLISFHKVSPNKVASLFSSNLERSGKDNQEIISLFAEDITTSKYDGETIYFSKLSGKYFSFRGEILFYSSSKLLVTDAIRTSNENTDNLFVDKSFLESYKTISRSSHINLIFNYNNCLDLINILTKREIEVNNFSGWTATDINIKDNAILASGISTINKAADNFIDIFNGQKSQELEILDIIPYNTTNLFAISFKNQNNIHIRKNEFLQKRKEFWSWQKNKKIIEDSLNFDYNTILYETSKEAGIFNTSSNLNTNSYYTYFKTKEAIRATSLLQRITTPFSSEYKQFRINKIIDEKLTANLFGKIFETKTPFFTIIGDYFIFGRSVEAIEYIIDNYTSKNILADNRSFKEFKSYISDDANIFLYLNPGKTLETFKNDLIYQESLIYNADSMSKFTAFSIQINTTKNGMIHNLCLFHDEKYKEDIKEEWYYPLDTISAIHPQFVTNHFTNTEIILIQDRYNNLIAFNVLGEKLWEKNIGNQILEKINFIDFYKNGKYQALFNTSNQLYLIDRNGNFVEGFPKNLPVNTSIGHSLFDYNKNKKYRIMIIGDDNMIYNLDKRGKNINGWKYKNTTNMINQKPIHFTVNNNDYILNSTNNSTTKLLALNGSDRVLFKNPESFANQVQVSKNGHLYAITNENKLWIADVNGKTKTSELPGLDIKSKILAYQDGYYLGNTNSISYINDQGKQIFNIQLDQQVNKLMSYREYIAISTNTSLYLLKDNKVVEGFPISSDGHFNISDIDNNEKINIINIKNGFIYNYELID